MLTVLVALMIAARPCPGVTPGLVDESPGLIRLPAASTGTAWWDTYGAQGVSYGRISYGWLYWYRHTQELAAFLCFTPSILPQSVTVVSADLYYYQHEVERGLPRVNIRAFNYVGSGGGRVLYDSIHNGERVSVTDLEYSFDGWNRFQLNAEGLSAIDSCRKESFLALGIAATLHVAAGVGHAYGHNDPEEFRPYLRIRYLVTYPDVGVSMLIAPADTVESGVPVVPQALVQNYSNRELTFPVRFTIGTTYAAETMMTLEAGAADMVRFTPWVPGDTGSFAVKCSTMLEGDEDPSNDCVTDTVVVVAAGSIGESPRGPVATPLSLHPNPARDRVWLAGGGRAVMYSPTGRRVMELQPGENDVRHLSPGVYLIREEGPGTRGVEGSSRKVIIQR